MVLGRDGHQSSLRQVKTRCRMTLPIFKLAQRKEGYVRTRHITWECAAAPNPQLDPQSRGRTPSPQHNLSNERDESGSTAPRNLLLHLPDHLFISKIVISLPGFVNHWGIGIRTNDCFIR